MQGAGGFLKGSVATVFPTNTKTNTKSLRTGKKDPVALLHIREANVTTAGCASIRPNDTLLSLEKVVERDTGEKADDLRSQPLDEFRIKMERAHNRVMHFVSKFPFIGRGNIMREKIVDHATVNRMLDAAIRDAEDR